MLELNIAGRNATEIASCVEVAVHEGRLLPGTLLPTVRDLAKKLRLSPTTVASAYKLLHARGLVSGLGRRGTRIMARPPSPAAPSRPPVPEGIVDLATGNPDPELLPAIDQALRAIDAQPRLYGGIAVLPSLATFAASEFEADGVQSSSVTVVGGGLDGIERVLREHLRAGDRVAVEDPAFPGVLDLLAANNLIPIPCAVDEDGPLVDAVEAALRGSARALVVTPRAQNPTGALLSEDRAAALRRVLTKAPDTLLIEDDHAGPIAGAPYLTLSEACTRWAVVRSVSKFLGPDLRVALIAGDSLTVARVEGRLSVGTRWVSHLLQQLVVALWSDPSSARQLARAADVYRQRREAAAAALAARGIETKARAGLNLWIPVAEEAHTVRALADRGWAVMPGERFRLQSAPAIRVTIAALKPKDAERFASDVAEVLHSTRSAALA